MKSAFIKDINHVEIRDVKLRDVEPDEIRLKIDACGICGTDVTSALDGHKDYSPFGHEIAGTVVETGKAVRGLTVGQKAALDSSSPCGVCDNCKNTRQELCTNIKSFWSNVSMGFAEEIISPAVCAIPYDGITPELACMSEPFAVAIDMFRLADIRIDSHVVVSGLGSIGLLALQLARLAGAERIYACGTSRSEIRNKKAKELGAYDVILVDRTPVDKYKFEKPPDRLMVTSPPKSIEPMIKVAGKGGIISYIGIKYGRGADMTFDANEFHFKKLQLRASFASPALFAPMALDLTKKKRIDVEGLITHVLPLDRIQEGLKLSAYNTGETIKVIIKP